MYLDYQNSLTRSIKFRAVIYSHPSHLFMDFMESMQCAFLVWNSQSRLTTRGGGKEVKLVLTLGQI